MSGGESMQPRYEPRGVEERWQQTWEAEGLYNAEPDPDRTPYVDCHPPPNVTGRLHTGHALNLAVGDSLIRWKRMQGYNTLFQPGFDHAGISTQNVVERALIEEGTSRQELGRDAFVERVWEWLHEYGGKILDDFRRIGASLDYRRSRMTMDDGYSRAVMQFFVHLYKRGWIYQANRIINWCPYHETSLSDLELEHEDVDDTLSTIRYPLADGAGHIPIATVRPATIPADVAVAVHPDDERYKHLIGREVIVPWTENRVPVIADERVEVEFGTGALKVTPAHDPTDFEIGRAHGLPEPSCIGPDGRSTAVGLEGLTQDEASAKILDWCRERDLLEKREHYRHSVAFCERCHSRIEPRISLQWWCSMERDQAASAPGAPERQDPLPPGEPAPLRDRLARERAGLVHLAPDLVGAPDPRVALPGRACDRGARRTGRVHRLRVEGLDARDRRARHLVQLGALAVRDPRLAGANAGARAVLSGQRQHDRARHHSPLGEPDDLLGPRADGRAAVRRCRHPPDRARRGRAPHVEVARQRDRRFRGARSLRRRRDALRPAEELPHPGRSLLVCGDRGRRKALEQAVERRAADRDRM